MSDAARMRAGRRQRSRTYAAPSGAERAAFLERIAEEILALGDELIPARTRKPACRWAGSPASAGARSGSCSCSPRSCAKARGCDARIDTAAARPPAAAASPDLRRMLVPIGPGRRLRRRAISRSPSRSPAATRPRRSRPATRSSSRRTAAHPGTSELVGTADRARRRGVRTARRRLLDAARRAADHRHGARAAPAHARRRLHGFARRGPRALRRRRGASRARSRSSRR